MSKIENRKCANYYLVFHWYYHLYVDVDIFEIKSERVEN